MTLEDEGKRMIVYSDLIPIPTRSWEEIRQQLCQSERDVTIHYTLKPLDEDEEYEPEHHGPPLALLADIRLGDDNDVEAIPVETTQDPLIDIQRTFEEQELAENKAFLSDDEHFLTKEYPKPETEFSNETAVKRSEMLHQHSGIDVLTPDGLKAW